VSPVPVVPLTSRLVATYSDAEGATAANVLHFLAIGGDFDETTGDGIAQLWADFFELYSVNSWQIDTALEWTDLRVDPPETLIVNTDGAIGDSTAATLPANVAACLSLSAASGGRSGRGRIYLPGISEEYVTNSSLSNPFITATIAGYVSFATQCAGTHGWVPAVYSRTDGISRSVLSTGMSTVVDTQRRRSQRLES